MATINDLILHSLAPGIALTSVIFFATGLQARFLYVASRARDLNKEARELAAEGPDRHRERLDSLRNQVEGLTRRLEVVRRTILFAYGGLFCFIATILQLLVVGLLPGAWPGAAPVVTFGLGFVLLAVATLHSAAEMMLSMRTLHEDVRTSFPGPAAPMGPVA